MVPSPNPIIGSGAPSGCYSIVHPSQLDRFYLLEVCPIEIEFKEMYTGYTFMKECLNSNHRLKRNNLSFLQVDEILRDSPCPRGQFDYVAFSRMLKHGKPNKNA